MIKDYKKIEIIEQLSQTCRLYKASKDNKYYFMYEYKVMNQCDQYNFKVIKKLVACSHVLGVVQKFEFNQNTYFFTDYVESNLLKEQLKQPSEIFQLSRALQIFASIVQIIEEIHQSNVIYRNLRIETIGFQKKSLYLTDFSLSQIVKRRQRYFQVVGVSQYLAPEFYSQDGYGYEVDVWAAGVCLYFMLTGEYPFSSGDNKEQQILGQIQKKCKKGFDFFSQAGQTKKAKHIQSSKPLQDLLKRIFELDYSERITIAQLKSHQAIKHHFQKLDSNFDREIMSAIVEESSFNESIFRSQLQNYQCHFEFHKEQVILDFLQHTSQSIMLHSSEMINQKLKSIINFSILKVATMKASSLIDILYGKQEPQFKINPKQWQEMRKTSAFAKVKLKIQRKKKIIDMLFRASYLNVLEFKEKNNFYCQQVPNDFSLIKHEYRNNLSKMFEIEKEIMKKKQSKQKMRNTCQNLVRLTILCLINRIFHDQRIKQNFELYFKWSKKQSFQDLEEWIQNQKITNLKAFIKSITSKYME